MTYTFKLSRRIARLRAPAVAALVLALAGCHDSDSLGPDDGNSPQVANPTGSPELASGTFAGGIPIGTSAQPNEYFGTRYNGAWRNIWPEYLLGNLSEIKARGGKIVLMMAGPQSWYKDADGHFSLSKWKARIDRYRNVNFSSYVQDGTIIAHVLLDEPNDVTNWNGQQVSTSTVEEMARYSKSIWPNLPTVVRAFPEYMSHYSGSYRYLDAAWAQYVCKRGDARQFIEENVRLAQSKGLALVAGMNLIRGNCDKTQMTPSQVESYGSALLSSTYLCAFISYQFNEDYLSTAAMKAAMDVLRSKAQNRNARTCRYSQSEPVPPPPTDTAPPPPTSEPLPFGLFQMPVTEYSSRWTGTLYTAQPTYLLGRLDQAKSAGMKVVVRFAGVEQVTNADGTFSLTKWKAQVDRFRTLALDRHVSNRTLYLHYLVDRPNCASCWGGRAISWETVEAMARYSKSIWPGLPTTVGAEPSELAAASFRWVYLDAGWAQYDTRRGSLRTYLTTQTSQARLEGLGLVAGLNLLRGSAGGPMTASQIKEFGTILAGASSVCALVGRPYDATYLSQSGIRQALDSVATVARSRTPASCIVN